MAEFDLHQQAFALSWAVNMVGKMRGDAHDLTGMLKAALTDHLALPRLRELIGTWSLAWGPVVWENPLNLRGVADNAVAVFVNEDARVYVVAIAATNPASIFDWVIEDGDVNSKVTWPYGGACPPDTWISAGTALGVGVLRSLKDPVTHKGLKPFLDGVRDAKASLVFTGHSLAGALSPTLALSYFPSVEAKAGWADVLVYPTAGATPGNAMMKAFFGGVFPSVVTGDQPWQRWNQVLWNDLDVVPHAWAWLTMAELPKLYGEFITEVAVLAAAASLHAGPFYVHLRNQPMTGTLNPKWPVDGLKPYLAQMVYQHVEAYLALLGVSKLADVNPPTELAAGTVDVDALQDRILAYVAAQKARHAD